MTTGQGLGYAGIRVGLPFKSGKTGIPPRSAPGLAEFVPLQAHRRGRLHAICRSSAPKSAVLKQQAVPIYQAEDEVTIDVPGEQSIASSEDTVIVTFRWPAALAGQDVSVVGEGRSCCTCACPYKCSLHAVAAKHGHCKSESIHACNAGSFTDWQNPVSLRRSSETNDFIRTIALQPGTYQVGE
jgi:hypothetical protein